MALLNSSFYCLRLRTGAIIIGYLGLLWSMIALVPSIGKIIIQYNCQQPHGNECNNGILSLRYWYMRDTGISSKHYYSYILWLLFYMLCCVMLIMGSLKANRFLVIPWLAVEGGGLVSQTVANIAAINGPDSDTEAKLMMGLRIIIIVIFIYFWFTVLSFYQVLHQEQLGSSDVDSSESSDKTGETPPPSYSQVMDMTEPPPYSSVTWDESEHETLRR